MTPTVTASFVVSQEINKDDLISWLVTHVGEDLGSVFPPLRYHGESWTLYANLHKTHPLINHINVGNDDFVHRVILVNVNQSLITEFSLTWS